MRYHHLRRSWAQRVLVSVIGPQDGSLPWKRYYETLTFSGTDPEHVRRLLTGREDMYASIDGLVDKLDRQVKKHKEKITNHLHNKNNNNYTLEETE